MKRLPLLLGLLALLLAGCAAIEDMTAQQRASALVRAAGEAYGAKVLAGFRSSAGVVDPAALAQYEIEVPKIANVMQGQMTPADFYKVAQVVKTTATPAELSALGFLDSITTSFVQYNGGATRTVDGSIVDAEAHQLAQGMVDAVGLTTGTNWTPVQF